MQLRYTGATTQQVRWANHDDPRGLLVKGEVYEVIRREVHSWHTKVYLVDFPKLGFNSVMFEDVEVIPKATPRPRPKPGKPS